MCFWEIRNQTNRNTCTHAGIRAYTRRRLKCRSRGIIRVCYFLFQFYGVAINTGNFFQACTMSYQRWNILGQLKITMVIAEQCDRGSLLISRCSLTISDAVWTGTHRARRGRRCRRSIGVGIPRSRASFLLFGSFALSIFHSIDHDPRDDQWAPQLPISIHESPGDINLNLTPKPLWNSKRTSVASSRRSSRSTTCIFAKLFGQLASTLHPPGKQALSKTVRPVFTPNERELDEARRRRDATIAHRVLSTISRPVYRARETFFRLLFCLCQCCALPLPTVSQLIPRRRGKRKWTRSFSLVHSKFGADATERRMFNTVKPRALRAGVIHVIVHRDCDIVLRRWISTASGVYAKSCKECRVLVSTYRGATMNQVTRDSLRFYVLLRC